MALYVYYNTVKGSYDLVQKRGKDTLRFNITIHDCNYLGAGVYHYIDNNGDETTELVTFWNDLEHAKNLLGLSKKFKGKNFYKGYNDKGELISYIENIRLNLYYDNGKYGEKHELRKLADLFIKAGYEVTLYYEEPKEV